MFNKRKVQVLKCSSALTALDRSTSFILFRPQLLSLDGRGVYDVFEHVAVFMDVLCIFGNSSSEPQHRPAPEREPEASKALKI